MWHVSISAQKRSGPISDEALVEERAIRLLAGAGGDSEWWVYSTRLVGHLRVPVTAAEYAQMPPGRALDDAGETGPQRPRTR